MAINLANIRFGADMPPLIFCDFAEDAAKQAYVGGLKKDRDGSISLNREGKPTQESNRSTQLRKFYDELVMWHDKVNFERVKEAKESKYKELAPFIKMLNAKVAYAKGRGHVDSTFEGMFSHVIKQISDAETLKHAKLFMEAFMGFYKAQEK
jgi:CRISPR-associated protein Csm2